MQVSRVLKVGRSGVFAMDQSQTLEPYFVDSRAQDLEDLAMSPYKYYGFGLSMDSWPSSEYPKVKWVNWRWPRYEWQT